MQAIAACGWRISLPVVEPRSVPCRGRYRAKKGSATNCARIQEVARAMRYTPAQELGGARIVLAISQVAMLDYNRYQFSWYVLQGLKERAKVLGVDLITHQLSDNDNGALQALLEEADVGGVLALTVDDSGFLNTVANLKKPAVLVNTDDPLMRLSSVLPCNRSATRMACEYLLERGHRDILFNPPWQANH